VATIALAPPAPNVMEEGNPRLGRGESGYAASMSWEASRGASSYRVVWREAWTPEWQFGIDVRNVTAYVLEDISIDDYVFGVMAIGPNGHESLVSAYTRSPRLRSDIREVGR
jgi:hypothetical protein